MTVSIPSAGLAVLGGLLTVLSPCILPVLPFIVGRSLQSHRYGPLALVVGLITGFAAIGSLLGVTTTAIAGSSFSCSTAVRSYIIYKLYRVSRVQVSVHRAS